MKCAEWEDGFRFEIVAQDSGTRARCGRLTTPHGIINTPAFMPVGTYGAVKGISPDELRAAGAEIILANALHLEFRPSAQTVQRLGGLHRIMGWEGPILTDSGGFQSFSLASLTKRNDEGLEIRSPVDGSKRMFRPEDMIAVQRGLGTDFMMPLDLCAPGDSDRKAARAALDLTQSWAKRSRQAYDETQPLLGKPQTLFGIMQGGIYDDLRQEAVEGLLEIGFFGYALGGLAVGEAAEDRWRVVERCDALLPRAKLRYLMGVGTPEDLRAAVSLGMDLFDCVLPTRNGRKGSLFTSAGKLNLRNAAFREDPRGIEEGCRCYACETDDAGRPRFSRGAIRHLLSCGEVLGARLGALHNLTYFLKIMADLRAEMAAGLVTQ